MDTSRASFFVSPLYGALQHDRFTNGLVQWCSQDTQPTYCGRINRSGLSRGHNEAVIYFYWIAAFDHHEKGWHCIWRKDDVAQTTMSGRSGMGCWSKPEALGIEHGRIGVTSDSPVDTQIKEHRVVVSHFDTTNQLWYGIDGIQPLTEHRFEHGDWQLTLIEPIPIRSDHLPVALLQISDLVPSCRLDPESEGVPYYNQIQAA
jgi:hypothetical protein